MKSYLLTQSYHAGHLTSSILRTYTAFKLPYLSTCMVNSANLRALFGERIWNRAKVSPHLKERVRIYEALAYQIFLPRKIIGTEAEFCRGFATSARLSMNRKKSKDDKLIMEYLKSKGISLGSSDTEED